MRDKRLNARRRILCIRLLTLQHFRSKLVNFVTENYYAKGLMRSARGTHAALFLFVTLAVAGGLFARLWWSHAIPSGRADTPAELSAAGLASDPNDPLAAFYRARLAGVLHDLAAGDFNLQTIPPMRDELLALRVPGLYQDLHLQIVLALGRAEEGLSAGQVGMRGGVDAAVVREGWFDFLRQMAEANPWILQ